MLLLGKLLSFKIYNNLLMALLEKMYTQNLKAYRVTIGTKSSWRSFEEVLKKYCEEVFNKRSVCKRNVIWNLQI